MSAAGGGEPVVITPGQPNAAVLPRSVLQLKPSVVTVSRSQVWVECGGGFRHYGFILLREKTSPLPRQSQFKEYDELTPGLWYYSE